MINLEEKFKEICNEYKVPVEKARSPKRDWELLQIRKHFAKFCRAQGVPYAAIGRVLNRDHSTIINLVKK